jgi:ribonuclease P protein component
MPYAYRKSERIRKNSEFVNTMKGKRLSVDGLSLFYTASDKDNFRVGISVSKKLGNAVTRNKLRRQIRACVMKMLGDRTQGFDLVFVARRELVAAGYDRIMKAVETILQRTVLPDRKRESAAP